MEAILKFLGILVIGAIAITFLAALGPFGAIIAFFIVGSVIVNSNNQDKDKK